MTDSEKLDLLLDKISGMESRMSSMESRMSSMESKISSMESKISSMESQISSMETDLRSVKLTVENEIRVNIQRVAEGHLDLSRNLHEAMKPSNEIEMLSIKVRTLESEVRELKRRIS